MPTIKKHKNRKAVRQRTGEGANHWVKQQGSKCTNQSCRKTANHSRASCFITSRMTSRPHRLKKTSSTQSNRRDLHHKWLHRETNEKKNSFYCYSLRWITTAFFTRDCSDSDFSKKDFFCKNPVKVSITRAFNFQLARNFLSRHQHFSFLAICFVTSISVVYILKS